jgi:rubrerythrin
LKIEPENKLATNALSELTKKKLSRIKYKCACCGNYTLEKEPPGTFEISRYVFGRR